MNFLKEAKYNYRRYFVAPRLDNVSWIECPYCHHKTIYDSSSVMGCFYCDRTIGRDGDPYDYIETVRYWKQFAEAVGPKKLFGEEHEEVMETIENIIKLYDDGHYKRAKELNDLIEKSNSPEEVVEQYDEIRLQQRN